MSADQTDKVIDDLHTAICQAVTCLTRGKNLLASSVLRQALADFPDRAASTTEVTAKSIDNLIDALLEAKSGEQIIAARIAIGLAFDELERKQARLVGTVTAMQSSLAELAFIVMRDEELTSQQTEHDRGLTQ